MKRSPLALSRMPPSPRTPSVISTPAPATPVGWNCQNSMSSRGIPARAAIPRPTPVLMKALVVDQKIRPAPPVANSVARACRIITSPVSISSAVTPSAWPPESRMRSSAIHSTKNWVRARTFLWYSVCSIAWPVRSAAQQERCTGRSPKFCEWPPNGRWYTVPFSLRSNGMPKCSSSYTSLGASRTMNSIASWSPSQSEPFTVSYMCHSHESSPMLPSAAPIPPWAATVCERVGNTLERTATLKPASDNCSAARRPAPPAPTTTTSKLRFAIGTSESPENPHRPAGAADEPHHRRDLQRETQAGALEVIHPDVAHADPRVNQDARRENKAREPHPLVREEGLPCRVSELASRQRHDQDERVSDHYQGGDALGEPVPEPVVRADGDAFHHNLAPMKAVRESLTTNTATAVWRAVCSSTPLSTSRNRCRTPAQRWCRYAHRNASMKTLTAGCATYAWKRANPASEARLMSSRN